MLGKMKQAFEKLASNHMFAMIISKDIRVKHILTDWGLPKLQRLLNLP